MANFYENGDRPHHKSFVLVLLIIEAATIALYTSFFFILGDTLTSMENEANRVAAEQQAQAEEAKAKNSLKTAKIAKLDDITIRSTVAPEDMTGVLFHQASYADLNAMTTKLPTADVEKALKKHSLKVNKEQTSLKGWADVEALHLYRQGNPQPMNTSVDIGGKAGCDIYAPVTGTVTRVKKYQLYGKTNDYRIHIQPKGHPEYDCVILHTSKPCVKKGDTVKAGVTKIAQMRKISDVLSGIQLSDYTKEGGNHSHVQIGNANDPEYRKRVLED